MSEAVPEPEAPVEEQAPEPVEAPPEPAPEEAPAEPVEEEPEEELPGPPQDTREPVARTLKREGLTEPNF